MSSTVKSRTIIRDVVFKLAGINEQLTGNSRKQPDVTSDIRGVRRITRNWIQDSSSTNDHALTIYGEKIERSGDVSSFFIFRR